MIRLASLAGATLILAGCAHLETLDDGLTYAERQRRLSVLAGWELSGYLVIDTGERRDRARVDWEQRGEQLSLTVSPAPAVLGVGSFRISGDASRLVIEGRGETRVLEDPEVDLEDELKWWLPIASLKYWLLGQPDPDSAYPAAVDRGPAGTLADLTQRDWRVRYEAYQLAGGLLLPGAITMTHGSLTLSLDRIRFELTAAAP